MKAPQTPPHTPPARRPIDFAITYGILGLLCLVLYRLFSPLFPAILWGVLLSIICGHAYERLVSRLRGRRILADLIFSLILAMVLLLPAIFFAWQLLSNLPNLSDLIGKIALTELPPLPVWITDYPVIGHEAVEKWQEFKTDLAEDVPIFLSKLGGAATWIVDQIGSFGGFLFQFSLGGVICVFLLHHRFVVRAALHRMMMRIGGADADGITVRALNTTRAAFVGVIAAAIVQTILVWVAMIVVGLPVVLFTGFTFLLGLAQLGPTPVLVVADIVLIARQAYLSALVLTLWFVFVVMAASHIIRPYFASKANDTPGILSFLGALGGFLAWGLLGVFVGPVLVSVLFEMFVRWNEQEVMVSDGGPIAALDQPDPDRADLR